MARTTPIHSGYAIINGSGTGPNGSLIDVWIEWDVIEQEIDNNRTYVRAYFYAALHSGTTSTWGGSGCYSSFSVNGVSGDNLKSNDSFDFRDTSDINLLGSGNFWVTHNSDGTKTVNMSGTFTTSSSWITGGSVSGNATLPTIPRATTPGVTNMTMGTETTIDLSSRASSSFTHTLEYLFGGHSGTLVTKTSGASYSFTPSLGLAAYCTDATSGAIRITCKTYYGTTLIGTKYVYRTLSIPSSVVPSISNVAVSKVNSNSTIAGWGVFVQGYSKVKLDVTAAGVYGSTIESYYYAVKVSGTTRLSKTQSGASWTSGYITIVSTHYTFYVIVTDSRGRTDTYTTGEYTVYAYSPPNISLTDAFRCDSGGTKDLTNGTYISAKGTFGFSSCGGNNSITKKIEYRQLGSSSWNMGQDNPADDTAYVFGADGIDTVYSYEVRFSVTDDISDTVTLTLLIKPGFITMHIRTGGKGIGFGGAADADEFQCYMDADFKGALEADANTVLHKGNTMVLLWSGSWSSGNITVTDLDKYTVFLIRVNNNAASLLCAAKSGYFRGGVIYAATSTIAYSIQLGATYSGTTLTWGFCHKFNHVDSSTHGAISTESVVEIWGVI